MVILHGQPPQPELDRCDPSMSNPGLLIEGLGDHEVMPELDSEALLSLFFICLPGILSFLDNASQDLQFRPFHNSRVQDNRGRW